jgi:hypothetical protein
MDKPFVDVSNQIFQVETPLGQGNTNFNSVGIGTGSKVFRADSSGIWLGASEYANAPFRVDMNGNVTMTSASIGGYVQKIGGDYTSASGTGARVQLLPDANTGIVAYDSSNSKVFEVIVGGSNVGDVTLGNYSGGNGMFWDDSASKFTIKGDMTAGTITGVNFQTASSGARVLISANASKIEIKDSSGNNFLELDDNVIIFAGRSSTPTEVNAIWYYKSGSNYGFRTRMESGNWQITKSAV